MVIVFPFPEYFGSLLATYFPSSASTKRVLIKLSKMKKSILFILVLTIVFACSKDQDKYEIYYKSLGVYEITGDGDADFRINLDNGSILIPGEIAGDLNKYDDGERVITYYSKLTEPDQPEEGQELNSAIHYINDILTKDVISITEENADSLGNDAIHVHEEDIWISNNFLNIYFSYFGANQVHFINMVKYPNDSVDAEGRLMMEFRHNSNNDYPSYAYDGLVSFDMNSLYEEGIDSLPIVVRVIDYYNDTLNWKDTYHFNSIGDSSKLVEVKNPGLGIK